MVTSAVPLGADARERLTKAMQARTGKKPQLIERVDESLLGGLVVQVGDEKLDCSVAHRLATLRESFRERASREIQAGTAYIAES